MSDARFRRLLFALYACLGMGYSLLMPVWEASDEPAHYKLALTRAREGRFPSLAENHEASQPHLYYWLASWPLALLDAIDPRYADVYNARVKPSLRDASTQDPEASAWQRLARHQPFDGAPIFDWNDQNYRFLPGPMALRWLNLLLGGLTLELGFRAARRLVPAAPCVSRAALALAALTPQFLHISASVSNDALANLAGALAFWLLSRAAVERLSPGMLLGGLVLASSLPFVTKLSVLPIALALLLALLWNWRTFTPTRAQSALALALGSAAALGIAGWLASSAGERLWQSIWLRAAYVQPGAPALASEIAQSFARSYWGAVGWMSVELPGHAWVALTLLAGIGLAGSLRLLLPGSAFGKRPAELGPPRVWLWLWIALVLTACIAGKNALTSLQAQGRYLFPSLGVIALSIMGGWYALSPRLAKRALVPATLGGMIALNLWMWLSGILPTYYQPFLG